ncbi:MAG: hypothetical protein K0R15_1235 [Clostridiales bacterium]|nr:hypothetical protein [Clostridiales bacterium]
MEKSFAIIELMKDKDDMAFRKIHKRYLPKNFFIKRILKKVPIIKEEIYICGVKGYRISFPLIEEYIEHMSLQDIEKLASQMIIKLELEGTNTYVIDKKIRKYFKDEVMICDGSALKLLLLDQIIDLSLDYLNVNYSNVKIAVTDTNNNLARLAINILYKKVKSLILITDRPEYFEDLVQKCKIEGKMEIEVIDSSHRDKIDVDILIQISDDLDKRYQLLEKGSTVLNIFSDLKQTKMLLLKRGDLRVIDDIEINTKDSIRDLASIQAALYVH